MFQINYIHAGGDTEPARPTTTASDAFSGRHQYLLAAAALPLISASKSAQHSSLEWARAGGARAGGVRAMCGRSACRRGVLVTRASVIAEFQPHVRWWDRPRALARGDGVERRGHRTTHSSSDGSGDATARREKSSLARREDAGDSGEMVQPTPTLHTPLSTPHDPRCTPRPPLADAPRQTPQPYTHAAGMNFDPLPDISCVFRRVLWSSCSGEI